MTAGLAPFLRPTGVVVVGASGSPEKLGYAVARNLIASRYPGAIHLVSQKPGELFGRDLYTDIQSIPDPVDLAVLLVPASAVPGVLAACGRRGIHAAIVESAGFREAGAQGEELEQQSVQIARSTGIRLLGPNCIGVIDTHLPLDTTFLQPPLPAAGGIGFISQSGAFCAAIIDWSRQQGIGFSQVVSLGNQADVTEAEMLRLVAEDQHTRVLTLYLEGVADGPGFVRTAHYVAHHKPILALKVGRSKAGQRAATSHTGALAGSDDAYDAAFLKAGVFRADSAEQMFDWARALESCPLPSGPRVAVLTDAGGPGVIATDALERSGLHLAEFAPATRKELAALLPPAASVENPIDMLASASPEQYAASLRLALTDPGVDSVLLILPPPPTYAAESVAAAVIPAIETSLKPVVVALLGSNGVAAAFDAFTRCRVPTYPFPERAASALAILNKRALQLQSYELAQESAKPESRAVAAGDVSLEGLLESYGIPTIPYRLAHSADEAAALGAELGFPVVIKIASPDIQHKSDVGGVFPGVKTLVQARDAYTQVTAAASKAAPTAKILGVTVQKQALRGQEVILGVVRDATFGPLVMFGSGGVEAEGIRDVAFALAPLTVTEAEALVQRTWAGRRLDGFRNLPPADKAAVADVLVKISWLAVDHPEFTEIEINPLIVFLHGAAAVDVRAHRGPASPPGSVVQLPA